MEIWTPNIRGDSFYLKCENENKHDKSVMDVMIRGQTGGNISKISVKFSSFFLLFQTFSSHLKLLESV